MRKITGWIMVAIWVLAGTRAIASGGYLYSLNTTGNLSVNGNKINGLPSSYDPSTPSLAPEQAWQDLAIVDGNQYALRGDGSIYLNAAKLSKLPYDSLFRWLWVQLEVDGDTTYALRQDGKLAVDGTVVDNLPATTNFVFSSLQVIGGATYSLRTDGSIFKNAGSTPLFVFRAGNGLGGLGDGLEVDTVWATLRSDPTGQYIYALRTDGVLRRGQLSGGTVSGELVDTLPFPSNVIDYNAGTLYSDFEFDNAVTNWVILRVNGKVYREPNALQPSDDFPGSGTAGDEKYLDLAVYNGQYFALRSDGKVFVEATTNALVDLAGTSYGRIEFSDVPPNLSNQKNIQPGVVQYTIPVNTGLPVKVPVIATDVETPTADLVVTPVSVPTGGVWDAMSRTLTWTAPALKGNYSFSYIVADTGGSAKTYTSKIQVKDPDVVPEKNKPPYAPKFKNATALVGNEYRLYIPLGDPDNDPVTVTVDPSAYPFNVGAIYDSMTSEFVWTPSIADLGKKKVPLVLSDGTATKKLNISIQVNSPLFITPLP